ncbi:MAG: phosphoribosylamine--glycine ligase [Actinobacteria bacterium]|nr:phosphoribosylamine--glycine ligase [Actinomycetota bacterium]
MRVLVVGGGGREHALCWGLARDPSVGTLFAAPGNAGIALEAECVPVPADDLEGLVTLVERERIDLTVVGPEVPLVAGLADELVSRGHAVFGPSRAAAQIEGSKAWAKSLMRRAGIPTARSAAFARADWERDRRTVLAFLHDELGGGGAVVKADGLAAGKGVVVADAATEAADAVEACLGHDVFGEAGARVVIEERLSGPEVSAFALTDGRTVLPLALAQDFKRVGDGDAGPNTGGMGAYSPVQSVDDATAASIHAGILEPAIRTMAAEALPYRGVLYAGVMLTPDGPMTLEFNCRFGDPETQVLLPRLASSPADLFLACARGDLGGAIELRPEACVTVVLASGGYPGAYEVGFEISGLAEAGAVEGVTVFHSGTAEAQGRVVTAGGRVLSVSAVGASLREARDRAYRACARVSFEGMHHRNDVAASAAEKERS